MQQNGILLLDKPANMTSFGVVARIRRVLSQQLGKKAKVGHCGTLDPFATGLLILVTGTECKNAGTYMKLDKTYEAVFHLGATSTTGDPEGEIMPREGAAAPSLESIKTVLKEFTGVISQIPPAFSAIKVNGRRAYDLARQGQAVEIPPREVTVYALDVISYEWPLLAVRVRVSSGTYIRSLAIDIGERLGTGAFCEQLRRLTIADWDVKNAKTLEDFGITTSKEGI